MVETKLKFHLLRASDLSPVNYKRVAEIDGEEVPLRPSQDIDPAKKPATPFVSGFGGTRAF